VRLWKRKAGGVDENGWRTQCKEQELFNCLLVIFPGGEGEDNLELRDLLKITSFLSCPYVTGQKLPIEWRRNTKWEADDDALR